MVRGLAAVALMVLTMVVLTAFLPTIITNTEGVRTDAAPTDSLACTSDGDGVCTVTLSDAHAYPDTSSMTVTETSPGSGDRTGTTTVASDRVTLTITGLAATTAYTFDVDYVVVAGGIGDELDDLLTAVPVLLVLGAVAGVIYVFVSGTVSFT